MEIYAQMKSRQQKGYDALLDLGAVGVMTKKDRVEMMHTFLKRAGAELGEAMADPEWAEDAFYYEMCNHEYGINYEGNYDVLSCFLAGLRYVDGDDLGGYLPALERHGWTGAYMAAMRRYNHDAVENGWF